MKRKINLKPRIVFWTVSLVAVIALYSCAPAVTSIPALPSESFVPAMITPTSLSVPDATIAVPNQVIEVQAIATSRGPNLEATDPNTVKLASGQPQLVEFFRFT